MTLKFWLCRGKKKILLPQSAFKVYSFWYSNWDKLSQDASSCWHTPATCSRRHCLLLLCHPYPHPTQGVIKRLIKEMCVAGSRPRRTATAFIHVPSTPQEEWAGTCWRAGLLLRQLSEFRPDIPETIPAVWSAHRKNRLRHLLSEGTWPSFIGRRRLSCNTDLIQQLARWLGMTPG